MAWTSLVPPQYHGELVGARATCTAEGLDPRLVDMTFEEFGFRVTHANFMVGVESRGAMVAEAVAQANTEHMIRAWLKLNHNIEV